MTVTGEQVSVSMIKANITHVDHHNCGGCGEMVFYSREGDYLFFHPGCGCGRRSDAEPRDWSDAANWINMQNMPEWREKIAARFGMTPNV